MTDDDRRPAAPTIEQLLARAAASRPAIDEQPPAGFGAALRGIPAVDDIDAEIATLLADTALDGELAGLRGEATLRSLGFAGGGLEIRIDVEAGPGRLMTVTVSPPAAYEIQLVQRTGVLRVSCDEAGVAELDPEDGGSCTVVVGLDGVRVTTERFRL